MIGVVALLIYVGIGIYLVECGFKYLREQYPGIVNRMESYHFLLIYILVTFCWLPMVIELIIQHALNKDKS